MRIDPSPIHLRLSPDKAKKLAAALENVEIKSMSDVRALDALGINITPHYLESCHNVYQTRAMDAATTMPGILLNPQQSGSPYVQFLQSWLPGQVHVVTQARKADALLGTTTVGAWEDAEIIQEILELVGVAMPYTDLASIPMSSWNLTYAKRGIVRFEEGCQVGTLEGLRSGRINIDSLATKREAAALALEIARNRVAFFGYANGEEQPVYGLLNDPNNPEFQTLPSGKEWNEATRDEIIKDLKFALRTLRVQSKEVIDPSSTPLLLVLPTSAVDALNTPGGTGSETGETAKSWLTFNYPNVSVESCVEFDEASGGKNVMMLYAITVSGTGTDDGKAIDQLVPSKFYTLGVDQSCKSVTEDFSNATAGTLVKRPYAIFRGVGV